MTVARAGGEELERVVEAVAEPVGPEEPDTSGGELDRKRKSVKAPANLRDGVGMLVGVEAGARRLERAR